jgi:tetratricopeptide (TPR) repeat protein
MMENLEYSDNFIENMVDDNFEYLPNPLLTPDLARNKYKKELVEAISADTEKAKNGFQAIMLKLHDECKINDEIHVFKEICEVLQNAEQVSKDNEKLLCDKEFLEEKFQKLTNLLELLGLNQEVYDVFFETANKLYEDDKFEEASDAFAFLNTLAPIEYFPLFMLAASEQNLGNFQEAIKVYEQAAQLEPEFPMTYIQMAFCSKQLKQESSFKEHFKAAEDLINNLDDDSDYKEMLSGLKSI